MPRGGRSRSGGSGMFGGGARQAPSSSRASSTAAAAPPAARPAAPPAAAPATPAQSSGPGFGSMMMQGAALGAGAAVGSSMVHSNYFKNCQTRVLRISQVC